MTKFLIKRAKRIFSSSPFVAGLFNRLIGTKIYHYLVAWKINRQILKDSNGPFNLVIENANLCNASCIMCPYKTMKRAKKVMTEKVFEKIIERVKKEKLPINKIFISGMGEPLIDPKFIDKVERLKKLGFPLRVYTNASLLTREISKKLILLGLEEINISFNGASNKQYRKIMGLDFKKTVNNINNLIKIKSRLGSNLPKIQVSLIVLKENSKALKKHLSNWKGGVGSVTVSLPHQWGGGIKTKSKIKFQKSKTIYPCRSLWHTYMIDSSGNFVICCRDYESKFVLGNIATDSFAKIRRSRTLKEFQKRNLEYRQDKLPKICQQCNFPYQGGVDWFLPRSLD